MPTLVPGGYGNATGVNAMGLQNSTGDLVTNQPEDLVISNPTQTANLGGLAPATSTVPGLSSTGATPTVGTNTVFPANTAGTVPGSSVGTLDPSSLFGLNSATIDQLKKYYGDALGSSLYNFLSAGAGYNPNVATAIANANAPYEQRARANILESFGASGNRNSSPAAIGLGDFESSYALGQQNIFANLFNNATDRYSNILGGLLDTAHLEQANKLGISDILSGLLGIGSSGGGVLGQILSKLLGGSKSGGSGGGAAGGGGGSGSGSGGNIPNIIDLLKSLFGGGGTNIMGNDPASLNQIPGVTNMGTGIMQGGGYVPSTGTQAGNIQDILNAITGGNPTYTGGIDTFGNNPTQDNTSPWGDIWSLIGGGGSSDVTGGGSSDLSSLFGLGDLSNYAPSGGGVDISGGYSSNTDMWSSLWDNLNSSGTSDLSGYDWTTGSTGDNSGGISDLFGLGSLDNYAPSDSGYSVAGYGGGDLQNLDPFSGGFGMDYGG